MLVAVVLCGFLDRHAYAQHETDPAQAFAAAWKLQELESYQAAGEAWERFLSRFPGDPRADQAYYYLGICHARQKRFEQAANAFRTVVEKYPKSTVLEGSYVNMAIALYNLGHAGRPEMFASAAAALETVLAKYPQGKYAADAAFYRAESVYLQGKKREGAELYAQFLARHPAHRLVPNALYAIGVSQEELGQPDLAIKTYNDFLAKFAQHSLVDEVTMRRGTAWMALGNYAEAIRNLASVASKPGFPSADYALLCHADCLVRLRQYPEAIALLAALPGRFPQSKYIERARLLAGKCHYLTGQHGEVRKLLDPMLSAGGSAAAEAAHWIVLSLAKQGQTDQAVALADRVLAQAGPGAAAAQLAMDAADALYEDLARRKESAARYAAVAAKYPHEHLAPQALSMAAFVALEQGDFRAALAHCNAFLAAYSSNELAVDVLRVAAESKFRLGQYSEADKLFAQLIEKYPKHGDVEHWKLRRVLALQMQKKHQETISAVTALLDELRTPDGRAEAYYLLGLAQAELKQYELAVKALAASVAAQPAWRQADDAWLRLAEAQRQLGDLAGARASLQKMIAQCPNSPLLDRAHYRLGEYAYAAGDYQAAAEQFRKIVEQFAQSSWAAQALHELGCTQLSLKDAQGAERTFSTLLAKHPQHQLAARARYARAMANYQLQNFDPAIEDLQAALAMMSTASEKSDAQYLLGLCRMGLKQYAEAVTAFQTLLAQDPNYGGAANAQYNLAWALKLSGKEQEAIKQFAKLAADYPASPLAGESHYRVGEFAFQNNDYQAAAVAYHAAAEKAAGTPLGERASHKLGLAFFKRAEYEQACAAFRYQMTAYPEGPLAEDACFWAAECLFKQEKYADALAEYSRLRSASNKEHQVLALLHAGQAAGRLGQWEKSLEWLALAAQQSPGSPLLPEILYEQAWAHQNLGHVERALAIYKDVIAKSAGEPAARAQLMIGQIQLQAKQHDRAAESFLKVFYGYSFPKWQADAAMQAARCYEILGKKEDAKRLYQRVIDQLPQTDAAPTARQRLAELK